MCHRNKKESKRKKRKGGKKKPRPLANNTNAENSFQNTKTFYITDQST